MTPEWAANLLSRSLTSPPRQQPAMSPAARATFQEMQRARYALIAQVELHQHSNSTQPFSGYESDTTERLTFSDSDLLAAWHQGRNLDADLLRQIPTEEEDEDDIDTLVSRVELSPEAAVEEDLDGDAPKRKGPGGYNVWCRTKWGADW